MRFYKKVWGIIWEFNSISEYASFMMGRLVGAIIFFCSIFLLSQCDSSDSNEFEEPIETWEFGKAE